MFIALLKEEKKEINNIKDINKKIILRMCDILTFMCHVEINVKWYSDRNILNVSF